MSVQHNPVAKHAHKFNKHAVHQDKKRASKRVRGNKHQLRHES